MRLELHFLCCILLKGLVAGNTNVGNQIDCARYVEVRNTGRGYEEVGLPSDGSPVIFKLDVDATLDPSVYSVYRNEVGGCMYVDSAFTLNFQVKANCTESPSGYMNYMYEWDGLEDLRCFAYALNFTNKEYDNLEDNSWDAMLFTTPEGPCSDCRIVTDNGAGSLRGNYALQDHYNFDCGSDTDGCAYEKDGETYCFKENGEYAIDFSCPA